MSRLYYRRSNNRLECIRAESDSDKRVLICLEEPLDGVITVNNEKRCKVCSGVGIFEEGELNDGIQMPRLICDEEIVELEPFHIGTGVTVPIRSEEYIRSLRSEIRTLGMAIELLRERVSTLEDKIVGKPIF